MTNKIINIDDHRKVESYETICIFCGCRTMHPARVKVALKDIKCESCGQVGGVILTGQQYDEEGNEL